MRSRKRLYMMDVIFFIFFGVLHSHRVWGLVDREGYADFWLGVLVGKGIIYYSLMAVMMLVCLLGIITFFRNRRFTYWWRWIYILGGGYVIFDLMLIFLRVEFWNDLLLWMFDVSNESWNMIWGGFTAVGLVSLVFGIRLLVLYNAEGKSRIRSRI